MLCDSYVVYKNMIPKRAFATVGAPITPVQSTMMEKNMAEEDERNTEAFFVDERVQESTSKPEIKAPVYHVKAEPVTYSHDQMNPDCSNLANLQETDKE